MSWTETVWLQQRAQEEVWVPSGGWLGLVLLLPLAGILRAQEVVWVQAAALHTAAALVLSRSVARLRLRYLLGTDRK